MPWRTRKMLAILMFAYWLVNPALAFGIAYSDTFRWDDNLVARCLILVLAGLFLAQPVLLAMWSMLGTRSWLGNGSWAACWLTVAWFSLQWTSQNIRSPENVVFDFGNVGLELAAIFMFECLVFAFMRWVAKRRLYDERNPLPTAPRITLREVLLSVTLLAITLGLTRTVFSSLPSNWLVMIASLLVFALVAAFVSLVLFGPCVWFAFQESLNLPLAAFLLFLNALFWSGAAMAATVALANAPTGGITDAFPYVLIFTLSLTFSSFATLLFLRHLGYRIDSVDRIAAKFAAVQPVASVLPGDDNTTSLATSSHLAEGPSP